jgi:two-component system OmpR family response regulator
MSKHILVIEDEPEVRSTLQRWLTLEGFQVTAMPSGVRIAEILAKGGIDLFLVDIGLPDIDGLTLTRRIREKQQSGVIIISGRGDLIDRVVGLEAGADDYVTKPFEPREIVARVRSVLRRVQQTARQVSKSIAHRYVFDSWIVDMETYSLEDREGAPVGLTTGEFKLLRELVLHPNRVLSRDRLIELTNGHNSEAFDRSIDVRIGRLRRKLNDCARKPRFIKTVRDGGYIFVGKPVPA